MGGCPIFFGQPLVVSPLFDFTGNLVQCSGPTQPGADGN